MANVAKQAAYLSHRTKDVEEVSARVARGLRQLRGRVEMARHAADSVKGRASFSLPELQLLCARTPHT